MHRMTTPLGATLRGLVAGAAGTAAMDLYWYTRDRLQGGGGSNILTWEFNAEQDWDKVGAPAQMGRRLVEAVTQMPLLARWAPLTNNVTHWGYGVSWGALYGLTAGSLRRPRFAYGLLLGGAVWATSYVVLPVAKLYKPIWEYDAKTLAVDLGAHLVYGVATAAAFAALD